MTTRTFRLELTCDNSAFDEIGPGAEIARILRTVASELELEAPEGECRDYNGNTVGFYRLNRRVVR